MSEPISIEEELKRNGKIVYKIKGYSMYPMLRPEKDLVVIKNNTEDIYPGDVVLYKRVNDKALILHRVIKINDNFLIIRGDHNLRSEKVHASQIIGVLDSYARNGKIIPLNSPQYRIYCLSLPLFRVYLSAKQCLIKLIKN